jgi:predicted HAD superfamily phosphohydrolase
MNPKTIMRKEANRPPLFTGSRNKEIQEAFAAKMDSIRDIRERRARIFAALREPRLYQKAVELIEKLQIIERGLENYYLVTNQLEQLGLGEKACILHKYVRDSRSSGDFATRVGDALSSVLLNNEEKVRYALSFYRNGNHAVRRVGELQFRSGTTGSDMPAFDYVHILGRSDAAPEFTLFGALGKEHQISALTGELKFTEDMLLISHRHITPEQRERTLKN